MSSGRSAIMEGVPMEMTDVTFNFFRAAKMNFLLCSEKKNCASLVVSFRGSRNCKKYNF